MAFLEVDGATLFYETREASARWVTLVNGFSRSSSDFRGFARALHEKNYSVLLFDNRGTGETEVSRPFTVADCASDIGRLWQSLGITNSLLVGISFGGALSIHFAAQQPKALAGLVVVSSSPRIEDVKIERDFSEYFSKQFIATHEILIRSLKRDLEATFLEPRKISGARAQRDAMRGMDLSGQLSKINVPTLVLHGDGDRIVLPAAAEQTAKGIAGSELEIWPGVGHLFLAECPKRFYDRVIAFAESTKGFGPKRY